MLRDYYQLTTVSTQNHSRQPGFGVLDKSGLKVNISECERQELLLLSYMNEAS